MTSSQVIGCWIILIVLVVVIIILVDGRLASEYEPTDTQLEISILLLFGEHQTPDQLKARLKSLLENGPTPSWMRKADVHTYLDNLDILRRDISLHLLQR
jgi:hypothetical protein